MVHRWSTSFEIERTSGGACSQDLVLSRRRRRPAQLANDVTVRVEGHVGGVSQLFGELRDRRALANPQGGEGVTQGVRRLVDAEGTRHRRPDPPVPVEPVVLAPSAAARSRKIRPASGLPQRIRHSSRSPRSAPSRSTVRAGRRVFCPAISSPSTFFWSISKVRSRTWPHSSASASCGRRPA